MLCLLKLIFAVLVRSFCARRDLPLENLALRATCCLSSTPPAGKILEWRPISLDYAASFLVGMAKGVDPGATGNGRWLASCRVHTVLELDFGVQSPRGQKVDEQGNP